jgi:hypothetical protein
MAFSNDLRVNQYLHAAGRSPQLKVFSSNGTEYCRPSQATKASLATQQVTIRSNGSGRAGAEAKKVRSACHASYTEVSVETSAACLCN